MEQRTACCTVLGAMESTIDGALRGSMEGNNMDRPSIGAMACPKDGAIGDAPMAVP